MTTPIPAPIPAAAPAVDVALPDPAAAAVGAAPAAGVAHRDKAMMLVATAARMGVGLLTFVAMARYLGPQQFGVIATAIAYATFIGIVTDYGLGVSALRTASAAPARADTIVSQAFATKLVLTGIGAAVALVAALALLPGSSLLPCVMVFVGATAYGFADLSMIALRARRRFDVEAVIVTATSVVMMLAVAGAALATRDLVATAAAFMVSRVLYLAAALVVLRRRFAIAIAWRAPVAALRATLRQSGSYALDSILTSLSSQVDVLLFAAMLSVHDIGVYQAGARLVQVILPFAVVLSTVYMPTLSHAAINGDRDGFARAAARVNWEFTGLAVLGGLGFAFVGPIVTDHVYGSRYAALVPLWRGFGLFALLRLASAGYGIQLAALGIIRIRVVAQVAAIGVLAAAAAWWVPTGGLPVTAWTLSTGALAALLALGGALAWSGRSDRRIWWTFAVIAAAAVPLVAL